MRKFVPPRTGSTALTAGGPPAITSSRGTPAFSGWIEGLEERRMLAATPLKPALSNVRAAMFVQTVPLMHQNWLASQSRTAAATSFARAGGNDAHAAAGVVAQEVVTAAAVPATAAGGALSGKVVYTHGGHGYVWRGGTTWGVMRGYVNGMMEDHGNVDQLNFFAEHSLAAGATVVPLRPIGHQLNEVIVDNAGPGFTTPIGSWATSASGPYWSNNNGNDGGNHYRFANTTTGAESAVARFTPTLSQTGFYPVYAWANPGTGTTTSNNRVDDQVYRINYAGGSREVKVAARMVGNGWIYLGNYYFEAGQAGNVEVSNKSATAGKVVIADAIRFGNGMGDYDPDDAGPAPISGQPREEECALYWIYQQRGWTAPGVRVSLNEAGGTGNPNHEQRNFSAMALWSEYMNNAPVGDREDRVFLSFHSDASSNLGARGTTALITTNPTLNQTRLAQIAGSTLETEMRALDGTHEYPWASRTDTLSGAYGEISDGNFAGEMDATIMEVAFHTNLEDASLMKDPVVRNDLGRAATHVAIKYFDEFGEDPQVTAYTPEPPQNVRATTSANGQVLLSWAAGPSSVGTAGPYGNAASGYRVWTSTNGYGFELAATVGNVTSHVLSNLPTDGMTYFMVTAFNAGGESLKSATAGAKPQAGRAAPILIVNNYSRLDRQGDDVESEYFGTIPRVRLRHNNTSDYVVQAGEAIEAYNPALGVASATDDAVAAGQVNLNEYHTVIWMSGEQSTKDETFDAATQSRVASFLSVGGKLFVSGSEIGWDLVGQANETPADSAFYVNTLHANFSGDDANTYATNSGLAGSALAGVPALNFDDGSHGTYNVDSPDILSAPAGSTVAMTYPSGAGAAVQWGPAGEPARLINMGFPFETIYVPSQRNALMGAVLNYFSTTSTILSPSPGIPDLVAATDTGFSNGDNITNRDNAVASRNLQFLVANTVEGATVNVYANGTLIGTAPGTAGTTTVTTTGSFDLADGAHAITATQQEPGRTRSAASASLGITVDTVRPTVDIVDVDPDPRTTGVDTASIVFSEPVTGFTTSDLYLQRAGTDGNLLDAGHTVTSADNQSFSLSTLTGVTSPTGSYTLGFAVGTAAPAHDVAGNSVLNSTTTTDSWVNNNALPVVTGVFVGSSSWTSFFNNFLQSSGQGEAAFGFRLDAASHATPLPWTNVNRLSVRFSEPVTLAADAMTLRGVRFKDYGALPMTYDPATFTATWSLPANLLPEKLLTDLRATGVTDAAGNALDGEWANPAPASPPPPGIETFPSGDGTPGGDFRFRLNVLPGDANRSGGTTGLDVLFVRSSQSGSVGTPIYSVFKDLDGNGAVQGLDILAANARQGFSLPVGEPVVP